VCELSLRSRSGNAGRVALSFALLLSMCFSPGAIAQGCSKQTYAEALRLFGAIYPELTGRKMRLDFVAHPYLESDTLPLGFDIGISELRPTPPAQEQTSEADRVGHLNAHFQFDAKDHRIISIVASGSFVESERQENLNGLVDAHPDWSVAQMTEALLSAGARFGPDQKDALIAEFPVDKLEPMVGKIQITSTKFTFRGNNEPPFFAVMDWTIYFRATTSGRKDDYFVSIEPFSGKITMLGRRGRAPK